MPIHNSEIANMLDHVADLLEIEEANRFRVRAYRNAAGTVRDQGRAISSRVEAGEDLSELPDIGEDLAEKITEIVRTGHLGLLDDLSGDVPEAIVAATRIPGIGPKRARALFRDLDLEGLDDLEDAARAGKIAALDGFGDKIEAAIAEELARGDITDRRFRLDVAEEFAAPLIAFIRDIDGVETAEVAGSYRRRVETVGDLDILAAATDGGAVIDRFVTYDEIAEVASQGRTRSTVTLRAGLNVDLRVVPARSWGAALHYFTGSKAHNIAGRRRAQDRGLKLNEYGLFDGKEQVGGATEKEVYDRIDLPVIDPVLREDRGEIEAAERNALPELIEPGDIRGDLHCHSRASDGKNTIEEMAEAARDKGHDYLAITDHSQSQTQAGGLTPDELHRQIDEIAELNARMEGIRLLASCEVDILKDGRLDFPDDLLDRLDLVVASIHAHLDLNEAQQTDRLIRAMDNPRVSIIGHPTGRQINQRRAYPLDMERVIDAARARGVTLELNANPVRLDLADTQCRMAAEAGVKLAISTDAHATGGLDDMRFGVDQARRGWLGAGDVVNTRSWSAASKLLRRD